MEKEAVSICILRPKVQAPLGFLAMLTKHLLCAREARGCALCLQCLSLDAEGIQELRADMVPECSLNPWDLSETDSVTPRTRPSFEKVLPVELWDGALQRHTGLRKEKGTDHHLQIPDIL